MFIYENWGLVLIKFYKDLKMQTKAIFGFLIAILAIASLGVTVTAVDLDVDFVETTVNGITVHETAGPDISILTGEKIAVRVHLENTGLITNPDDLLTDVRVRAYISGEDDEAETSKFDMLQERTYSKLLSLEVPSNIDLSPSDDYTLIVVVEAKEGDARESYAFTLQRESYSLDILNVEVENTASVGSVLALDIVLKNRGSHRSDDTFVVARNIANLIDKQC